MEPVKSLSDWLLHLEGLHPKGQGGIELGLERINRVKTALHQKPRCPLILVGGTNGKGSTCAYLEAIYSVAGYRVGCYTSPHLLTYNERIRVDRTSIDDATLCQAFAKVEAARQSAGHVPLTYFEFGTLAAWEVFAACQLDVIILEVGLGGRLDAVNTYNADCAVVTGVAIDHTDWLGSTRESIGFEKAGIYRSGKPAICADPEPPQSLLDHAAAIGADLQLLGRDFGYFEEGAQWTFHGCDGFRHNTLPNPLLRGLCQLRNASAALAVIGALKGVLPVDEESLRRGLVALELPGRFQVFPASQGLPTVILDVAHNPQAMLGLADNLSAMGGSFAKTIAVVGMLVDKDIAGALTALSGRVDIWLLSTLDVSRGASATALADVVVDRRLGGYIECFASPLEAFTRAAKLAKENDRILAFGSFYTVAAVMRALKTVADSTNTV